MNTEPISPYFKPKPRDRTWAEYSVPGDLKQWKEVMLIKGGSSKVGQPRKLEGKLPHSFLLVREEFQPQDSTVNTQ